MSDNHLTILVVEPGKPPYPRQIPDTLQAMQEIVGGDIDATYPYEDPVALIFNSSGKFAGLQPNRLLRLENGDPYDVVCGTFFLAGLGGETFVSLTPEQLSDEAVYESQARTQAQRDTVDTELAQKYFAVQLARSIERLQNEMLHQQELEVRKALRFEKTGTISRLERMAVEVNRDTAKRELLTAQTNRRVAESELAGLLREENVGELKNPLFVVTEDIGTLKSWQDKALGASPVLKSVVAQRRQAEQGVTAAKAAWHPQVYAFANYNMIKHYLTIPEPDWIAGIGLKFTLWDNKDRNASIAAANSLVTKAQAAHDEARNRIQTAVQTAYLKSNEAREAYRLTDSTLSLAKENLRLREKGFSEGLSTADEVNDARTKLLAAEIARRVAAYRFVVAWAMLNAACGDMNAFEQSVTRQTNIFEY